MLFGIPEVLIAPFEALKLGAQESRSLREDQEVGL